MPYNRAKDTADDILNKKYKKNIKIMNKIKISDINFDKYLINIKNKKLVKAIQETIIQKPDLLLKDFLNNFLLKYDTMCEYFNLFYEELFNDIKLTDFYQKSFVLFL